MARQADRFFTEFGALDPDDPSYIERPADRELLERCLEGEYCHILTSRQVGKTSLVARAFRELQGHGIHTLFIDLQPYQNYGSDAEQFYYGIASTMAEDLELDLAVHEWWDEQGRLDPVKRLTKFVAEVVLREVDGPLVIFIDEIDSAIELPFSDDFFIWIRSCYTARPFKPFWKRLSFVLVGTAQPDELIKNPSRTPYNIGHRILLEDFSLEGLQPFAKALSDAGVEQPGTVLRYVFQWTSGHPYLTQRLCAQITQSGTAKWTTDDVNGLVQKLFLSETAYKDRNVDFIDTMIERRTALNGEGANQERPDRVEVLRTYGEVRLGMPVLDDENSPIKSFLRLCGLVKRRNSGDLAVRNAVYATVFNLDWVRHQLRAAGVPESELQRYSVTISGLLLRAVDVESPNQWRWTLTDQDGRYLADHRVTLDQASAEYAGFIDLRGWLNQQAIPDRRAASEAELVDRLGRWISDQVLGSSITRIMADASPVVVRVSLPSSAEFLLARPLELAHVDATPLVRQNVSLVFEPEDAHWTEAKRPIGDRLRMLAVFSLPSAGVALALRRERYALSQLVRRVAARYGVAVELHALQYGVTRERLRDAVADAQGWDVVHFSGHGLPDGLVLERLDGASDVVSAHALVELFRPARVRLKLVTLSSPQSAAVSVAEVRRSMGLEVPAELEAEAVASRQSRALSSLAHQLVRHLGCAVLAMRYPVDDDLLISLNERLYEGLFGRGFSLTQAVQRAIGELDSPQPVAAPALFGELAPRLTLTPPRGQPTFNVGTSKVAYFPPEPARFVGRAGVLARATTALAPENREQHTAVLLHGMAGAGKTACALELAYGHEQTFGALVWWQAPEQGRDITTSLRDLAVAMETQLPGLVMAPAVGSAEQLAAFLPRLSQLLEDNAVLVVLDNLESLLTPEGAWQDPSWRLLVEALIEHGGNSRLVLTSRVRPAGLDGRVLVEPVHALSWDEALLLARELPHLGQLLRQDETLDRADTKGAEAGAGWQLVLQVLNLVQGHPKLLELADAQATDPEVLQARLAEVERALPGQVGRLDAFFAHGESQLAPEHFLKVLESWTKGTARTLPDGARILFWLVCALEEADRWQPVVEANWADLWRRLDRSDPPPALEEALGPLLAQALVQVEQEGKEAPVRYRVHPGVAEAARREAGEAFQAAVDTELAAFWEAVFSQAMQAEGGEASGMVVRAGRSAAPYLLRLGEWAAASQLLEQTLRRDRSPATVAALLPLLGQVAQATGGTDRELADAGLLARTVTWVDPVAGERQLRAVLAAALAQHAYELASGIAGDLVNLLRRTGRLREALALIDDLEGYTRQAGLGPWTQLLDRAQRLQLLYLLGEHEQVLAEVQQLYEHMARLPEASDQDERTTPWNVRETILEIGALAAQELGRWEVALELNGEVTRSRVARDAPVLEQARARFNDYAPLVGLGRLEDARALLQGCRVVYQAEGAIAELGRAFSALADLEFRLDHLRDAISMAQAALRYGYAVGDPHGVATTHFDLANYLRRAKDDPTLVVAHRLAAALLDYQTGEGRLAANLRTLADDLAQLGEPAVPGSFAQLDGLVGQVEGVRLADLLAGLPGPAADGDQALVEVLRLARELPAEQPATGPGLLEQWDPVIAAAVAAAHGNTEAASALEPLLAELDQLADWMALAGALRRILVGERGQGLLEGLDRTDAAIVAEILERLETAR